MATTDEGRTQVETVARSGPWSMAEIRKIYEDKAPVLDRAAGRLQSLLEAVVATIEDKTLVRAEVRRVRIKELSSVQRKAESSGWKATRRYCSAAISSAAEWFATTSRMPNDLLSS